MTTKDALTLEEFDTFMNRLRATVAEAESNRSVLEALSRLVRGEEQAPPRSAPAVARTTSTIAEGSGRGQRVPDTRILEMLRAASDGLLMHDIEREFGQHVETLRLKLRGLRARGLVRTSGPRNQLRYHATGPVGDSAGVELLDGGGGEVAPRSSFAGTRHPGRGRGNPRGRAASPILENLKEHLLAVLRAGGVEGVAMATLQNETQQAPKVIRHAMEKLRQSGQAHVTGQRRSTRYHAGV